MGLLYLFIAVLLHELGHYTVCRWYGITPKTVCVFFNPSFSLLKFTAWGTQWRIGWLPFGGYTDIPGWQHLPHQKQFPIAIAGIVANYLAATLCLIYAIPGQFVAINLALAGISLLPFAPYDGSYIFKK